MAKRPVCVFCLLLMLFLCMTDRLGFSLIRGNPLPDSAQEWIRKHPDSTICGEVVKCEDTENSLSVYLKDTYLIYHSEKISIEQVKVFLNNNEEIPVGSVILVSGKLEEIGSPRNPGEFDSKQYYACRHIYYYLKNATVKKKSQSYSVYGQFLVNMRERFERILEYTCGNQAAAFDAIVLGDKSALEPEEKLRYQMGGIIHILAISGLHISLLGVGLYNLLKKTGLGIWPSGFISLAIMLQYGMMTGGSVSTMRAVCMFLLSVGAKILGRIYDMFTGLALSAILILMESPSYLLDSGFLLSFGAVLGIGTVLPALEKIIKTENKTVKTLMASVSVQLCTLPVVLWFYGEVSIAGIFLNLIVLPTAGIVLISGTSAALLGLLCLPLSKIAALPGRAILAMYEILCKMAAKLPFCTWIAGRPTLLQAGIYYLLLILILAGGSCLAEKTGHMKVCISFCTTFLACTVLFLGCHPEKGLKITCLDVGQGDGIVADVQGKWHFLVDGGSTSKSKAGQYVILPFLKNQGISRLDGIFVSHTDEDHINGISQLLELMGKNLTSVKADALVMPLWTAKPENYRKLEELAKQAGVKTMYVKAGDRVRFGETTINVLWPPKGTTGDNINEDAMVFMLEYKNFQGLFTGDIGEETERKLLGDLKDIDFLKVAHHGSRYSTCDKFLNVVKPELGVISCSSTNKYGHPSPETIERLNHADCRIAYTMKTGAVTVITNGNTIEYGGFVS
ncbi:MAG: DNA internalization-related competence protein ComEC/Rec2 [Clostridia bacterium]|nr:DNA internalization-related competence protein ComEC/Rec2 [Clostridia bacterium]MDY5555040.1 DNA internalization-related competence protein ComEC/Rec2 [Blautia sp.]